MMNTNENQTWFKWDYVCTNCDANITMTIKSNGQPHAEICPNCNNQMTLMSVLDVTIYPTQKKEENMNGLTTENLPLSLAEQYNPNMLVTYKVITDGETTYKNHKVTDIEWELDQSRRNEKLVNTYYNKEHSLRDIISEAYTDSQDQDTLLQIAELFNIPLTKNIEYTATITVSGIMEVDLTESYDINEMLYNNLSVEGNSDVEIHDWDIYSSEEL